MVIQNWKIQCLIQHFSLQPMKFKDSEFSFQWSKTWLEFLEKVNPTDKNIKQAKNRTKFNMSYIIHAESKDVAIRLGKDALERWLNIAALLFDDGMQIIGPIELQPKYG